MPEKVAVSRLIQEYPDAYRPASGAACTSVRGAGSNATNNEAGVRLFPRCELPHTSRPIPEPCCLRAGGAAAIFPGRRPEGGVQFMVKDGRPLQVAQPEKLCHDPSSPTSFEPHNP
jgi:hypothetical protein